MSWNYYLEWAELNDAGEPAAPPEAKAGAGPNEIGLVRLVLSAHQSAYARFHNGEGRGVIESDDMAISYASVELAKALVARGVVEQSETGAGLIPGQPPIRCSTCGMDLSDYPVAASAHVCNPDMVKAAVVGQGSEPASAKAAEAETPSSDLQSFVDDARNVVAEKGRADWVDLRNLLRVIDALHRELDAAGQASQEEK